MLVMRNRNNPDFRGTQQQDSKGSEEMQPDLRTSVGIAAPVFSHAQPWQLCLSVLVHLLLLPSQLSLVAVKMHTIENKCLNLVSKWLHR